MTRTIQIRNPRTGANDYTITPFDRVKLEARCSQLRFYEGAMSEGDAAASFAAGRQPG